MKINKGGVIGGILESGGTAAKKSGKAIAKTPGGMLKIAASQMGFDQGEQGKTLETASQTNPQQSAAQTQDIVEYLYGSQNQQKQQNQQVKPLTLGAGDKGSNLKKEEKSAAGIRDQLGVGQLVKPGDHPELSNKDPEELKKITELRQILHKDYYEKLTSGQHQQDERPAEKIEREEQEKKKMELEKEKEKPQDLPIAVKRGRQRVERLKGVSG